MGRLDEVKLIRFAVGLEILLELKFLIEAESRR